MNTLLLQTEIRFPVKEKNKFVAGLQYVYQNSSGDGGNTDISKRYYEKGSHTWAISTRLGYETPKWITNINFIHISNDGRFLMPREWGVEPFYTFLPRERNEGLGGVSAWTINNKFISKDEQWKLGLSYGQYYLPLVDNYRLNKYGLPSYRQLNAMAEYAFKGYLKKWMFNYYLHGKANLIKSPLRQNILLTG